MHIQWLTTYAKNPGPWQSGWKLHAIAAQDTEKLEDTKGRVAACGLRPRHGWSIDLFINVKCKKCVKKIANL